MTHKILIPTNEFDISFARSSGSGGQNVNKVNTKATLKWNCQTSPSLTIEVRVRFLKAYKNKINDDGILTLSCEENRTQHLNIKGVIEKLHNMIDEIYEAPKLRKKTKPTKSSQKKRVETKRIQSFTKKMRSKVF